MGAASLLVKRGKCGSPVAIDLNGPSDDTIIMCQSCGAALDRLGDMKAAIGKAALEAAVAQPFEGIFKSNASFAIKKKL
jgi:hypothetical protein